ncbi:MAG: DUF721 domain-containing protein [Parachlamydiales bacterium]|jgi:hypothetical protein
MEKNYKRNSIITTNKHAKDVLPKVFRNIEKKYLENPKLIINYWPEIIGQKLSKMTEVLSFENNTLFVLVKSSTLYSILKTEEKTRLLNLMQKKFSKEIIKNIIFKIG